MNSPTESRTARLRWPERVGYGVGDAGFNFYWAVIGSYLVFFYTDVCRIPAAAVATMVTVTKIVDAITDPAMGAVADRTRTRWGRFRPYILFGSVPLMGAAVLALSAPDSDYAGKLWWAYATYGLLMVTYTMVNIPYNSLSGVLTSDPNERTALNSSRFFFAYLTSIFVGAATPGVVRWFGGGDLYAPAGWRMTMGVYAAVATILFVLTFVSTTERVQPAARQRSDSAWQDLRTLFACRPWLVLFLVAMAFMITMTLRSASSAYYFRYFVGRVDLLGTYVGIQFAGLLIGATSAAYVTRFIGKKRLLMVALLAAAGWSALLAAVPQPPPPGVVTTDETSPPSIDSSTLLSSSHQAGDQYSWVKHERVFWIFTRRTALVPSGQALNVSQLRGAVISVVRTRVDGSIQDSAAWPRSLVIIFILNLLISIALGFKAPLTWAMYADVADYNEWRTGVRATAMTFSATTFSQKLGSAAGSALLLSVLAALGYEAGRLQSGASTWGIVYMQSLIPAGFAVGTAALLGWYRLDDDTLAGVQLELQRRLSASADAEDPA